MPRKSRKSIYPCGFLIILSMISNAKCRDAHFAILYLDFAQYKLSSVHRFRLSCIKDADKIEKNTYKTASIMPYILNSTTDFFYSTKITIRLYNIVKYKIIFEIPSYLSSQFSQITDDNRL